jgi:hypothetical protein
MSLHHILVFTVFITTTTTTINIIIIIKVALVLPDKGKNKQSFV